MAWWAGVPINGVVGWSPKQWRSGLESQAVAWWAGVPINGVVPDSLANQSINWSMMPVNPVNGGLSRRAAGSYGKCLPRKKISRVIMNKREKSEDEQKRIDYR